MLKRIHVNQHVIRRNRSDGRRDPPITVRVYNGNVRAERVRIDGPCEVVYLPDSPLPCGARLWIETRAVVHAESGTETVTLR